MKSVTKIVFFLIFLIYSCEKISETSKETIPLAPDELTINLLSPTKVELNWIDRSTNEQNFIIERKLKDQSFSKLVEVNKDVTKFIDSNLSINQFYTYRVYTTNSAGKSQSYSNEFTVHTKSIPIVTTVIPKNILRTSFTSGGSIVNDGGQQISSKGLVWSTQPNATISLTTKVLNTTQNSSFENNVTNLKANTEYFVRAFAINSLGVGYGEEVKFSTLKALLPSVDVSIVDSSITYTSCVFTMNLLNDGEGTCSELGICFSTKPNPTLNDSVMKEIPRANTLTGYPNGWRFQRLRKKLIPNTRYYVKSYAKNESGISFSQEISFNTQSCDEIVLDPRDSTYYPVNQIGNQYWIVQNMEYHKDWKSIPLTHAPDYFFNNNVVNYFQTIQSPIDPKWKNFNMSPIYGYPYVRFIDGTGYNLFSEGCPVGYKLPSRSEVLTLISNLGGANAAGAKLKSVNKRWPNWRNNTNLSRFSALPASTTDAFGTFKTVSSETNFITSEGHVWTIWDWGGVSVSEAPIISPYSAPIRCIRK